MVSSLASSTKRTGQKGGSNSQSPSVPQIPHLGNFDRLYKPFRILSGHDLNSADDDDDDNVPRLGNWKKKKRCNKRPKTPSSMTPEILESGEQVATKSKALKVTEHLKCVAHDSSSEDDTLLICDDISIVAHSLASTPATSPDVSPLSTKDDDHHDISDLETGVGKDAHVKHARKAKSLHVSVSPPRLLTPKHMPPGTVLDKLGRVRQTTSRGEIIPLFSDMQRERRAQISAIINSPRISSAFNEVFLPWDSNGVYHPGLGPLMPLDCLLPSGQPSQSGSELDHISQSAIDPLYRLDRVTQLKVIEALLDPIFEVDDLLREHFLTATKAAQPIHVFIDASNIIIGFYGKIKQARYIPIDSRIRIPSFFFEGFATAIERGRPCAKRIFAGSMKPGASTPNYMSEAASLGYEMNILQRVKGSKKTRSQYDMIVPGVYIPESFDHSHREQGVDEILQLKMMHTLIDTAQPGTMVVATGDAAEAEFSDGFHKCVVRALQLGWLVEVVGFRENMSSAWFANDFMKKWALQLRIFTLDNLVEEFLTPYYS